MPKSIPFNLVLELGDTNIPADPCKLPCVDKHYIVVRPKDYDKRKKVLKHEARFIAFTITKKTRKDLADAIIEDAKRYKFKNA
jgi:homospermidine synthase